MFFKSIKNCTRIAVFSNRHVDGFGLVLPVIFVSFFVFFFFFVGGVNLNNILQLQYQTLKATFLEHHDITFYYVK